MTIRTLGKSNLKASSIGMGCWALGGPMYHKRGFVISYGSVEDKESIATVKRALELGVTLFDTANNYGAGRSERVLGQALLGKRDEVIIATKFGTVWDFNSGDPDAPQRLVGRDVSPEGIRKACDTSLKNLQTDYIDFYQIHSGSSPPEEANQIVATLEDLVSEGKIRYYGWSTDKSESSRLITHGKNCAGMQFRISILHSNKAMFKLLDDENLFGLIKGPIGGGLFSGKYKDDSTLPKNHMLHGRNFAEGRLGQIRGKLEELRELLVNDGRTIVQAALGYVIAQHDRIIPIPGAKTVKQVEENAKVIELGPLPKKLVAKVDDLFSEIHKDQSEIE